MNGLGNYVRTRDAFLKIRGCRTRIGKNGSS